MRVRGGSHRLHAFEVLDVRMSCVVELVGAHHQEGLLLRLVRAHEPRRVMPGVAPASRSRHAGCRAG